MQIKRGQFRKRYRLTLYRKPGFFVAIGVALFYVWAILPYKNERILARQAIDSVYTLARAGDYESTRSRAVFAESELKTLDGRFGRPLSHRIAWESVFYYPQGQFLVDVDRERAVTRECVWVLAGYDDTYSSDFAYLERVELDGIVSQK